MFGFATDQQQADLTAPEKVVATAEVLFYRRKGDISFLCTSPLACRATALRSHRGVVFLERDKKKNQHAQQTGQKNRTQQRNPEYAFTRPFKKKMSCLGQNKQQRQQNNQDTETRSQDV